MYRICILIMIIVMTGCANAGSQIKSQAENEEQKEVIREKEFTENNEVELEDQGGTRPDFERTVTKMIKDQEVIANPENIETLVNKTKTLPDTYTPVELEIPNIPFIFEEVMDKRFLKKEAINPIENLFAAAEKDSIELFAVSGYRSFERQDAIYQYQVELIGIEEANQVVASPGQSEHQLGLALDVTSNAVGLKLTNEFGETAEGIWLRENAFRFGFIIRYPLGKESLTGYQYEPWHIRYVGNEVAEYLHKNELVLEQLYSEEK